MSIFVDQNTKVVYQGLTGSQGRYYGLLNRDYGTQVVAGTNPKKAGTDVDGVPVFASVADAVAETGANASCIFIPAAGVKAAVLEAAEGGVEFIVCITEGVPAQDEAWFYNKLQRDFPNVQLLGRTARGSSAPASATSESPPVTSPRSRCRARRTSASSAVPAPSPTRRSTS